MRARPGNMANEKLGRFCMNEQVAGLETAPRSYRQYIAANRIDAESGRTFEDLDPFNGEVCRACQATGKSDAENAIVAAMVPFRPGPQRTRSPSNAVPARGRHPRTAQLASTPI